jgi:shikimate dehydrogenase
MLTGSFSSPAAGNPTGVMMEAAYRALALDARYLNCEVAPEHLGDAVKGARAMGWAGFNLSIPHKVAVLDHLDRLAASAAIIGAVNCVLITSEGELVGENTDGQGFVTALRGVANPAGAAMVILGAGGAARAIAVETAMAGASSITIVNRDRARGQALVDVLVHQTPAEATLVLWEGAYGVAVGTDILVNATPVGLSPDVAATPDVDLASLMPEMIVADVVPNPPQTALLGTARERGCTTLDGLGMLVYQGAIGIHLWTGLNANTEVMRDALERQFRV